MKYCAHCTVSFRPKTRTQRFCSRQCAGLHQWYGHTRTVHKWGSNRPRLPKEHRNLRAQLLPAAIGQPCPLCGRIMDRTSELDHIIPRAQGGQTIRGNCRIICAPCNHKRGAQLGGRNAHRTARRTADGSTHRTAPATPDPGPGPGW